MGSKSLTKRIGTTILLKISKVKSLRTDLGLHKSLVYKVWPWRFAAAIGELLWAELALGGGHFWQRLTKKGVCPAGVGSPRSVTFLSQSPGLQKRLPCVKFTTPTFQSSLSLWKCFFFGLFLFCFNLFLFQGKDT